LDEIGSTVYEEMSFKVKVYGRRTKSDHKSSPCHFVTGELKIKSKKTFFNTDNNSLVFLQNTCFCLRNQPIRPIPRPHVKKGKILSLKIRVNINLISESLTFVFPSSPVLSFLSPS
jgi:hypothetical protein